MMDGWMISLAIAVCGVVSIFAVTRFSGVQNSKRLDDIGKKVDEHSEMISEHKITLSNSVTMAQVDDKFLTRDLFRAHERHIDQRFGALEKKIDTGFDDLKVLLTK